MTKKEILTQKHNNSRSTKSKTATTGVQSQINIHAIYINHKSSTECQCPELSRQVGVFATVFFEIASPTDPLIGKRWQATRQPVTVDRIFICRRSMAVLPASCYFFQLLALGDTPAVGEGVPQGCDQERSVTNADWAFCVLGRGCCSPKTFNGSTRIS